MASINTGKVVTGGLVAGVIITACDFLINGFILAADNEAMAAARNIDLAAMETASTLATVVVLDLVLGLLSVWAYAAIRPRFGPGPGTAVRAGLLIFGTAAIAAAGFTVMGMMPVDLFLKSGIAYVIVMIVATVAGASLYSEA